NTREKSGECPIQNRVFYGCRRRTLPVRLLAPGRQIGTPLESAAVEGARQSRDSGPWMALCNETEVGCGQVGKAVKDSTAKSLPALGAIYHCSLICVRPSSVSLFGSKDHLQPQV